MSDLPKLLIFGANGQDGRNLKDIYFENDQQDKLVCIGKDQHREAIINIRDIVEDANIQNIVYLAGFNLNTFEVSTLKENTISNFIYSNALDFGNLLETQTL